MDLTKPVAINSNPGWCIRCYISRRGAVDQYIGIAVAVFNGEGLCESHLLEECKYKYASFWDDQKCLNCGEPKSGHGLDNGLYCKEFIEPKKNEEATTKEAS